jgi:hypothetical protein
MLARRLAFASLLSLSATTAGAVSLIPLTDNPGGQSPETSAQQLWQWANSFDRVVDGGDPINDETGAFQNKKQTYPVHMLGWSWPGSVVDRSFWTYAGKPFVIPLIGYSCVGGLETAPEPASIPCEGADEQVARDFLDSVDWLTLRINGETLIEADGLDSVSALRPQLYVESGLYPVDVAPNSTLTALFGVDVLPPGIYPSSYQYSFLAFFDLPAGRHTIEFGGGNAERILGTYNIRVAEIPLPAGLPLLAAGLGALGLAGRWRRVSA